MKQGMLETLVGFFVLIIAAVFFAFAYKAGNSGNSKDSYILEASFQNVDGILKGSDVKLAGIKIGVVESIILDDDSYYAIMNLKINNAVNIPKDSTAIVSTNGLLGGKYIRITPGALDDNLTAGEKIRFTQSALNFEELIGKLMYSLTSK